MPVTLALLELPARIEMEHPLTPDEFYDFCAANPDLRVELAADGVIRIMPPCGLDSDEDAAELIAQLRNWAKRDGRGQASGSSAGFTLPDGSVMAADATWTLHSRRQAVGAAQRRRFPRLAPDFVAEVMSPNDRLSTAQEKMRAWIANGVRLGWLVDPDHETVYVYRPGARVRKVVNAERLVADPPLDGFVLDLTGIWD